LEGHPDALDGASAHPIVLSSLCGQIPIRWNIDNDLQEAGKGKVFTGYEAR
jgi:hypothetical protein